MKNNEKKKSTLLFDAIALFVITLVSGLALSFVFEVTLAPRAEQLVIKAEKANKAVFTDAEQFIPDEALIALAASTDLSTVKADYKGITIDNISKAISSSNELLGYNITVSTSQGYKELITMVIGYSKEGEIKGVEMIALAETPGLGMNAGNSKFIEQFLGKQVSQFVVTKQGAKSAEEIDAISSATITTNAVVNAVNAGIGFISENAAELGGGSNE